MPPPPKESPRACSSRGPSAGSGSPNRCRASTRWSSTISGGCTTRQGCVVRRPPSTMDSSTEANMNRTQRDRRIVWAAAVLAAGVASCSGTSTDSITVGADVPIVYVKRPVSALGNPTDAAISGPGGDLFLRDRSSPSGSETNLTGALTNGMGDVTHPEVSFDGTKVVFAMRRPIDNNWGIWEYDNATK